MKAATRITTIDSRTNRIELRAGAKGKGQILWACQYWPDSSRSVEEMDRMLSDYCARHDIQLTDQPEQLA